MNPRAPRAISELIVNALPELRERLVEEGIRRSWPAVVGAAVAAIGDEALRDSARRLRTTARRSLVVVTLAALAAGCAAQGPVAAVNGDEPPRRTRFVAPSETSDAYYHYSAAQMMAQNGRFREAIAAMEQAIKRDSESAFLWREMAQWLARTDQTEPALAAARKAVQLAPEDAGTHLTLAELLRAQKRYGEAEAELERVITLNPSAEEPYLTLDRKSVG